MSNPMIGCRVPADWQAQIIALQAATGMSTAEICRDAIAKYLGRAGTANRTLSRLDQLEQQVKQLQAASNRAEQATKFLAQMQR